MKKITKIILLCLLSFNYANANNKNKDIVIIDNDTELHLYYLEKLKNIKKDNIFTDHYDIMVGEAK